MRTVLALAILQVALSAGLAPLFTHTETIDKNGTVPLRSHIVIFNENAPVFQVKEKLQSWIEMELPAIDTEEVVHYYEIGDDFRGFAAYLTPEGVAAVRAHNHVRYVEEDQVMRIINDPAGVPETWNATEAADPIKDRRDWGEIRVNQKARNLNTINPAGLYASTTYPNAGTGTWEWASGVQNAWINTGSRAKIWIVDTGVYAGHQEFSGRTVTLTDFAGSPPAAGDCNGHGTHCAGSAAGLYRGVAFGADIGSVRVLNCQGSGTNANVIAGFNYVAANQVAGKSNILSASLGGGKSTATDDAISAAIGRGVVTVVAAGNDNNANCCNVSPAGATGAITVGATGSNDARASFSNSGTCLNVFAPGVSIHSAWYTGTTTYNTISGTSMATPLVAGAIALYATQFTSPVTNAAVRSAITSTSVKNVVTGTLLAGTPNEFLNARWA